MNQHGISYYLNNRQFRNFFLFGSAYFSEQVLMCGLFVWMARVLGPSQYGAFVTALVFTRIAFGITELGLNPIVTRELARNQECALEYLGNAASLRLLACVVTFISTQVLLLFLNYSCQIRMGITIMSVYMVFLQLGLLFQSVFRGFERHDIMSLVMIVGIGIIFSVSAWFLMMHRSILLIQYAFAGGAFLQFCLGLYIVRKHIPGLRLLSNFIFWRRLLKRSLPLGLVAIFSYIYFRIDALMLSFYFPDREYVGLYDAAYTVFYATAFVPMVLYHFMLPLFSRLHVQSIDKLQKTFYVAFLGIFLYAIIVCSIVFLFSQPIIDLVYGEAYAPAGPALRLLSVGGIFFSLCIIAIAMLIASGLVHKLLVTVAASALLNVVLNCLTIGPHNICGAAFSTVVTELFMLLLSMWYIYRHIAEKTADNSMAEMVGEI